MSHCGSLLLFLVLSLAQAREAADDGWRSVGDRYNVTWYLNGDGNLDKASRIWRRLTNEGTGERLPVETAPFGGGWLEGYQLGDGIGIKRIGPSQVCGTAADINQTDCRAIEGYVSETISETQTKVYCRGARYKYSLRGPMSNRAIYATSDQTCVRLCLDANPQQPSDLYHLGWMGNCRVPIVQQHSTRLIGQTFNYSPSGILHIPRAPFEIADIQIPDDLVDVFALVHFTHVPARANIDVEAKASIKDPFTAPFWRDPNSRQRLDLKSVVFPDEVLQVIPEPVITYGRRFRETSEDSTTEDTTTSSDDTTTTSEEASVSSSSEYFSSTDDPASSSSSESPQPLQAVSGLVPDNRLGTRVMPGISSKGRFGGHHRRPQDSMFGVYDFGGNCSWLAVPEFYGGIGIPYGSKSGTNYVQLPSIGAYKDRLEIVEFVDPFSAILDFGNLIARSLPVFTDAIELAVLSTADIVSIDPELVFHRAVNWIYGSSVVKKSACLDRQGINTCVKHKCNWCSIPGTPANSNWAAVSKLQDASEDNLPGICGLPAEPCLLNRGIHHQNTYL